MVKGFKEMNPQVKQLGEPVYNNIFKNLVKKNFMDFKNDFKVKNAALGSNRVFVYE
jgi:hypothetical protein